MEKAKKDLEVMKRSGQGGVYRSIVGDDPKDMESASLLSVRSRGGGGKEDENKETVGISTRVAGLVCLTSAVEQADESILPASFGAMGESLGISAGMLGSITFGRSLVQALVCPLIAPMTDRMPLLLAVGIACFAWGVLTALIGLATDYWSIFLLRAVTGLCISVAIPSLQSLMSRVSGNARGKGFGLMQFIGSWGGLLTSFLATYVGSQDILGWKGWRCMFVGFGLLSMALGVVLAKESLVWEDRHQVRTPQSLFLYYSSLRGFLCKRTFVYIIAQGIVGVMPWKAFAYLTLVFQSSGFTDAQAAEIVFAFRFGTTLGNLVGGTVADILNKRFPGHGYLYTAQISVGSQLPLSFLCFKLIPYDPSFATAFLGAFFLFGLCISWCGLVNASLFSEVVPIEKRNAVYAFNYSLQGVLGSAIIPLVALVADEGQVAGSGDAMRENIFRISAFASVWVFIIYTGLHSHFHKERGMTQF